MSVTAADIASAIGAVTEGLRLQAYQDSGGVWSIGIGETGPEVKPGLVITPEQAWGMFALKQSLLLNMVADKPPLEAGALVDFGYNCGAHALAKVLSGQDTVDNPVHTTDRTGKVRGGLVARRRLESLLIQISRGE